MHRRIAMLLSSKEAAWLAQLPYFVRSEDLGAVFVHAGLQSALPLEHQDQWVMMTIRSLLPSGRATSRLEREHKIVILLLFSLSLIDYAMSKLCNADICDELSIYFLYFVLLRQMTFILGV